MTSNINREDPESLYVQLKNILLKEIEEGRYKEGERIPTYRELCQIYGISMTTVKQAISELVHEGIISRRRGMGTFINASRKQKDLLRREVQKSLVFVTPDIDDPAVADIFNGIEEVTSQKGYQVVIMSSSRRIDKEIENLKLLPQKSESGAIIFPNWGRVNAEQIFELKRIKYPFVLIDRYFRDIQTDRVTVDNSRGAYEITNHLIKLGHGKIAHISALDTTATQDKIEGYKKALNDNGIPFESVLLKQIPQEDREPETGGYREVQKLLTLRNKPTAVFAGNDPIAIGALQAIRDSGLKVPEDIALVGFDDSRFIKSLGIPLTTVAQPFYEEGAMAVRILVEKIEGGNMVGDLKQIILPVKLVVRDTCGAKLKSMMEVKR